MIEFAPPRQLNRWAVLRPLEKGDFMDIDELMKSYKENPSKQTEVDLGKLLELPRLSPPMLSPNISKLFNPKKIVERIDTLTQSSKTIEERLDKLKRPHWLPIIISILALVVAVLAWLRPTNKAPSSVNQIPTEKSQPSPTQSQPVRESTPQHQRKSSH
jgi:hypothetical protein